MRYLVCFGCLSAALLAASDVGAQDETEGARTVEAAAQEPVRGMQRGHPEAYEGEEESSSAEPALVLTADDGGLDVSPGPGPRSIAAAKVQRAKSGLAVSCVFVGLGVAAIVGGVRAGSNQDDLGDAIGVTAALSTLGAVAVIGGLVGIGLSSGRLTSGKQELRELQRAERRRSRKVRWDQGTSRFVF